MKTFDHENAWKELALPAYKKLPTAVLCLVEETAIVAEDLGQDRECCMIWPEDGGKLRQLFERLDSETLSNAAHVVYSYGHWRPGASIAGDAPTIKGGAHWKFSHYADQVLRTRFNISRRDSKAQISCQIHEGKIRVCYLSSNMWTWHEVAPATDDGFKIAGEICDRLIRKLIPCHTRDDRDNAAYKFFEDIKKTVARPDFDISGYMVEESELELRRALRMPKPDKEKLIAKLDADLKSKIASLTAERDGFLWLVNHDLPTENAIYYNHTGRFNFGWRKPITGEAKTMLLERLAGFPFPFDVQETSKY
jgi:hypothetical protein